jgi:hypothetical protein
MSKPTLLIQEFEMLILACKQLSNTKEPVYMDNFIRRLRLLIDRLYLVQTSVTHEPEMWIKIGDNLRSLQFDLKLFQGTSLQDQERYKGELSYTLDRMLLLVRSEEQNNLN